MSLPPPPGVSAPVPIPAPPDPPSNGEPTQSRAPLVIGIGLILALFLGGALVWRWAARPEPSSDATVSSERFGYCISLPSGWWVAESSGEELSADQFLRPDGDTTLTVQAVETSRDLDAFAEDVRQLQGNASLVPGEVITTRVAGIAALRWDADLGSAPDAIRHDRGLRGRRRGVASAVRR